MKLHLKKDGQENGYWMKFPVTGQNGSRIFETRTDISKVSESPYIDDVKCKVQEIRKSLIGKRLFQDNNLELLNEIAEQLELLSEKEQELLNAVFVLEQPDNMEQVSVFIKSLDRYTLNHDICSLADLGKFWVREKKVNVPAVLKEFIDYTSIAIDEKKDGCMLTPYGFIRKLQEPVIEATQNRGTVYSSDKSRMYEVMISNREGIGREYFQLPVPEDEIKKINKKIDDMSVRCYELDELFVHVPPFYSLKEINQVLIELNKLEMNQNINRKTLLAILEAEIPETIEKACEVIRNYNDYQLLPVNSLEPKEYAYYVLERERIEFAKELHPYVLYEEFGQEYLKKDCPRETFYGVVVNMKHPFSPLRLQEEELLFYSPLTLTTYSNYLEPFTPKIISGEGAIQLKEHIEKRIAREMEKETERGLAENLYHQLLNRKIISMFPGVEEYEGELWGVLKVKTARALTERETAALIEEWREIAQMGWGEQLLCHPMKVGGKEIHIGFWDVDNEKNLFIKTEEEFKGGFTEQEMHI